MRKRSRLIADCPDFHFHSRRHDAWHIQVLWIHRDSAVHPVGGGCLRERWSAREPVIDPLLYQFSVSTWVSQSRDGSISVASSAVAEAVPSSPATALGVNTHPPK